MIRRATLEELRIYGKGKCPLEYMQMLGIETFVEIGVREGNSFFGRHLGGLKSGHAWAIDIWKETGNPAQNDGGYGQQELDRQYQLVVDKARSAEQRLGFPVTVIREFSALAAGQFDDESLDWVFIDADHSYEGCKEDIEAWYPKVVSGGVLCGHDYIENDTYWRGVKVGVKQAVDEFCTAHSLDFHVFRESECPTWYLVKP